MRSFVLLSQSEGNAFHLPFCLYQVVGHLVVDSDGGFFRPKGGFGKSFEQGSLLSIPEKNPEQFHIPSLPRRRRQLNHWQRCLSYLRSSSEFHGIGQKFPDLRDGAFRPDQQIVSHLVVVASPLSCDRLFDSLLEEANSLDHLRHHLLLKPQLFLNSVHSLGEILHQLGQLRLHRLDLVRVDPCLGYHIDH